MIETPVDAVITWVDGNDPLHRQRLAAYLAALGGGSPRAAKATRFHDAGELEWCVTSILRYAPWIRRIHIVTDRQTPHFLSRLKHTEYAERIRIVDHEVAFRGYQRHLPTFNSRAIITTLWRIPDLAENYLFFNDDFALIREVTAADFFNRHGVVLRGSWRRQSRHVWSQRLLSFLRRMTLHNPKFDTKTRAKNLESQELSAQLAGFERNFLRIEHLPFPQRRSTLEAFFQRHPELFERNVSYQLRSSEQFKTEVLAMHLEAKAGSAMLDTRLRTVQLKPSQQWGMRVRWKMARADADSRYAFVCVQSLELAPKQIRQAIEEWLLRRVGRLEDVVHGAGQPVGCSEREATNQGAMSEASRLM